MADLCPICRDVDCIHSHATASPPPPGVSAARWARLVAACRAMDARFNPRKDEA